MVELKPKFLEVGDGNRLVVLTEAEYNTLIDALSDAEEDAADAAVYRERKAMMAKEANPLLPAEVSAAILRGDRLLKALRGWRDMTQMHLSHRTGLTQSYLSDLEAGKRGGTAEVWAKIAEALKVPPEWLLPRDADA